MPDVFLTTARAALALGVDTEGFLPGDSVLAPAFVCDVVWETLISKGIRIIRYETDDSFRINWNQISQICSNTKIKGLVLVHFFGQANDLDLAKQFCSRNQIILIEDNAHGFGGNHDGIPLGKFGSFGISSPRKHIAASTGGILHLDEEKSIDHKNLQTQAPPGFSRRIIFLFLQNRHVRPILRFFRYFFIGWKYPPETDPDTTHIVPLLLEPGMRKKIENHPWNFEAENRRKNWVKWARFFAEQSVTLAIRSISDKSCPWCIPVYATDLSARNKWLRWALLRGYTFFPWPDLPRQVAHSDLVSKHRWERLFCVSLTDGPP